MITVKSLAFAWPPPPPSGLTLIGALAEFIFVFFDKMNLVSKHYMYV